MGKRVAVKKSPRWPIALLAVVVLGAAGLGAFRLLGGGTEPAPEQVESAPTEPAPEQTDHENAEKVPSAPLGAAHNPEVVGSNPTPATTQMYAYIDGAGAVGVGVYFAYVLFDNHW